MKNKLALSGWVLLTVVYHFIFWGEKMGVNIGIFQILSLGLLLKLYPSSFKARSVQAATLLTITATAMVIWHNSFISKFAYFSSWGVMVGFIHQPRLKSVIYACYQSLYSLVLTIAQGVQTITKIPQSWKVLHQVTTFFNRHSKLVIIPTIIFFTFFGIFKLANPVFDRLTNQTFETFVWWLGQLQFNISPLWIAFISIGAWLTAFILFNWHKDDILHKEQAQQTTLLRSKRSLKSSSFYNLAGLRQEYKIGIITIASVNGLLFIINCIDVSFIWFNFDYSRAGNLTKMVHEGTYLLILSILLAMGILLYFFRRNLNFYPANQALKKLAYLWILQNTILVISVALRTIYYITATGLAYKRIGVLIFLSLTLFGLFTLYKKIKLRKTVYYLWQTNSWAAYVMMSLMSLINWDRTIVSYNYTHFRATSEFEMTRSVRTLDLVDQYLGQLSEAERRQKMSPYGSYITSIAKEAYLKKRVKGFLADQKSYSWLSWNYGDWRTKKYLEKKHK